jgi:hypothetical protein
MEKMFEYPLDDPKSVIYYPLDPYHLVMLCTQECCDDVFCDKGVLGFLKPEDVDFVRKLNDAQYSQCLRCVIARSQNSLSEIQRFI